MAQLTIRQTTKGDLRDVSRAISKSSRQALLRICRMLRADIVENRLNKPRTGRILNVSGWARRKGIFGKIVNGEIVGAGKRTLGQRWVGGRYQKVTNRLWRLSGPPQYPQVLSPDTRRLIQSITARVEDRGEVVVGRVGTNVFYGAIHELQNRGRAWLRPALRDKYDEIVRTFGGDISAEMTHLDIKGKTTITETVF